MDEQAISTSPAIADDYYIKFSDGPMFEKVMADNADICKEMLEVILGQEIAYVDNIVVEDTRTPALGAKGIRMDAVIKADGKVYDIEMQASKDPRIGKRLRYYQSALDTTELNKGKDYGQIPDAYVIFICTHDELGFGIPVYTFGVSCAEEPSADLETGYRWIILNASAYRKASNIRLRSLLEYVYTGNNPAGDALVESIACAVAQNNQDRQWREVALPMLSFEEKTLIAAKYIREDAEREIFDRGIEQGVEQGIEQGEDMLMALFNRLKEDGRLQEAVSMMADKSLFHKLACEYKLRC